MNLEEARNLSILKQIGTELNIAPKISGGWNRGTLQAGYKEDADSWLRNWRTERGLPPDSGVLPSNRDEVPPYLRGWIFPKADASQQNDMMIAGAPYQDGPLPSRLFYNRQYESPDLFIKDRQTIDDAKQRFMDLTGIPLAKGKKNNMMIAHGEYFDDEGEPIEKAPYIFNRNTTELEVPWLKEDYYKDLPRRKELHDKNYHT